jgi:hypothetical protein
MSALKQPQTRASTFQISLRVRHPSIDPAEISQVLQLEAEHSFKAGSAYRSSAGGERARAESYWLAALEADAWKNEEAGQDFFDPIRSTGAVQRMAESSPQIAMAVRVGLLRRLNNSREFLKRLRDEGGAVSVLIQLSPEAGPLSIDPLTSKLFAELGVMLEIDCAS